MANVTCVPNYVDAPWSYYRFEPSRAANIIFIIAFVITSLLHVFQLLKTKTWYMLALVIGGCCEVVGYLGRLLNALEKPGCWTLGPFIMQNLLILIAPALMAASIYMILGRIILLTEGEKYTLIRKTWLTKIFVGGDVLSLLMQASGGGLMAAGAEQHKLGENLIVLGLFVQLAFFGFFVLVASLFHMRMARAPTSSAQNPQVRWKLYLVTLYVTGILIWVRSLFRVIEFIQGNKGELMRKELYVFVFDGALMLLVMLWMNWFHPGEIGLLLRGEQAFKNGIELIGRKRRADLGPRSQRLSSSMGPSPAHHPPTHHTGYHTGYHG